MEGMSFVSPFTTAAMAVLARGATLTKYWAETAGSTSVLQR